MLTIVQARLGSARLPGKVIKKYRGLTYLEVLIKRLRYSKKIKKIIVATSKNLEDIEKMDHIIKVFVGKDDTTFENCTSPEDQHIHYLTIQIFPEDFYYIHLLVYYNYYHECI